MSGLMLIIVGVSAIFVFFDAKRIGTRRDLVRGRGNLSPGGWAIATLGLWIVALPTYLIYRPRLVGA
jgi:hypothetical protein